MKVLTVVGARPQFIKASPVSKALRASGYTEYLVHTGQHYDHKMSQLFFDEMGISSPDINLHVGSGSHGKQTGEMLMRIEEQIIAQKPDWVLVYGDTNSTIAGALAAVKLHIPVAHVEAGLRSFNRTMPEEHNRILTDHCSDLLFCPTQTAVDNLIKEGVIQNVHLVGDTMYDAVLQFSKVAQIQSTILRKHQLTPKQYLLLTVHRPYNTDSLDNLKSILDALQETGKHTIFPAHPRTIKRMLEYGLAEENHSQDEIRSYILPKHRSIQVIDPVGYLDMLMLLQNAETTLTDSGGLQKEAYFCGVACITLRNETEWVETVQSGWNILAGTNKQLIKNLVNKSTNWQLNERPSLFGTGNASKLIVEALSLAIS